MAKKLCFIVMLSLCLLIVEFVHANEESPSPAVSPGPESSADSPLPPSSSPEADSPQPPASSPEPDSPQPPASSPETDSPQQPPPSPQPESPSPSPSPSSPGLAPVPAPSDDDDDSDDDSETETEYFPSPTPAPAPELGMAEDIKASEDNGEEFEYESGEGSGMSGLKKAVIAIGAIIGVGTIVIGALIYKKRKDNMTRARYTYFTEGEFL